MKFYLSCILLLTSLDVFGCSMPPNEQHVPALELISRTNDIVLARAVAAELREDGFITYTLLTERVLKGNVPEEFKIIGFRTQQNSFSNFNDHFDDGFWNEYGGREVNFTDCEIYPSFLLGSFYLIFLNQPYHNKGFELIVKKQGSSSEKDKWLEYVESEITR
ncbi:hypothetical protein OAP18_02445 [Gammaproteobacteria bacterium]|nr:hypothetical protein [Gammaproteobacteria bacterium]